MPYADTRKRNGRTAATREEGRRRRLLNLARGGNKRGAGEPTLPPDRLARGRAAAAIQVADAISAAMLGIGHRQLSRRAGRDLTWALRRIYSEDQGTRLSTMADIATAAGYRLRVELERADPAT